MFELIKNVEKEIEMEKERERYMRELKGKDDEFFIEKSDQFKSFYKLFNQKRER